MVCLDNLCLRCVFAVVLLECCVVDVMHVLCIVVVVVFVCQLCCCSRGCYVWIILWLLIVYVMVGVMW